MAIVLPFIEREREQVLRLLAFIRKLSGAPLKRTLYLAPFKALPFDDMLSAARTAFADVQVIADNEGAASDWKKDDKVRDAAGPNSLFRQAAWFFHLRPTAGPWLWLEPDCVPLVPGWDDTLEAAYRTAGKPFFGARMKFQTGDEYLNGVAIYPRDAVGRAPALVTRAMWSQFPEMEIAFDVAGGAEVLRQSHFTDLIQFDYRSEPDGRIEPREGTALFHGDRNGELLAKLMGKRPTSNVQRSTSKSEKKKQGGAVAARRAHNAAGSSPAPATRNGNGVNESIGDQIRGLCDDISALIDGHSNRKTRLLREIRKRRLLPLR